MIIFCWYTIRGLRPPLKKNLITCSSICRCTPGWAVIASGVVVVWWWGGAGSTGYAGDPGQRGARGFPGSGGGTVVDSFLIARHSQNASAPDCPPGASLIYAGYSLLFINANEKAHGQDLGGSSAVSARYHAVSRSRARTLLIYVLCPRARFSDFFRATQNGM